jgi:hypothetical protein
LRISSAINTAWSAGLLDWHWIVEHNHHAIPGITLKRAAVLDDDFADGCMIFAQERHHVFWV